MTSFRQIEHVGDRVETGPVQFGDDWPGVFIRGDNALALNIQLAAIERRLQAMSLDNIGRIELSTIANLRRLLASCKV